MAVTARVHTATVIATIHGTVSRIGNQFCTSGREWEVIINRTVCPRGVVGEDAAGDGHRGAGRQRQRAAIRASGVVQQRAALKAEGHRAERGGSAAPRESGVGRQLAAQQGG